MKAHKNNSAHILIKTVLGGGFCPLWGSQFYNQGLKPHPCSESTGPPEKGLINTVKWYLSENALRTSMQTRPVKGVPKVRTWLQALKRQSLFSAAASSCLDLNLSIWSKATPMKQAVTGLTWTVWKYTSRITEKNSTVPGWLTELEIRWGGVEILEILILGRRGLQRCDNSSKFLQDWAMVPFWAHSRTALPTPTSSLWWDLGHVTSSDQQIVGRSDVYHLLPRQTLLGPLSFHGWDGGFSVSLGPWVTMMRRDPPLSNPPQICR